MHPELERLARRYQLLSPEERARCRALELDFQPNDTATEVGVILRDLRGEPSPDPIIMSLCRTIFREDAAWYVRLMALRLAELLPPAASSEEAR